MDIKVNQAMPIAQTENAAPVRESDGTFKFTLVSHIEEQELQARLGSLMEQINPVYCKYLMHLPRDG